MLVVAGLDLAEADAAIGRRRRESPGAGSRRSRCRAGEIPCAARRGLSWRRSAAGCAPVSTPWIEAAARRPSAIASIRFRGPRATSPPAQMRGSEVRSESGSTCTPPARLRSSVDAGVEKAHVGALADREDDRVGRDDCLRCPARRSARSARRRRTPTTPRSSPGRSPCVSPTNRCGPRRYTIRMPSRSASSISSGSAGISSGDSSATIVTSSTPARRAARATSSVVVIARRASSSERGAERNRRRAASSPADGGAERGARRVERDVAPADDDDPLAEVDAEALVHVEEVLDGAQHAVELVAGEVEVAGACRCRPRGRARRAGRGARRSSASRRCGRSSRHRCRAR